MRKRPCAWATRLRSRSAACPPKSVVLNNVDLKHDQNYYYYTNYYGYYQSADREKQSDRRRDKQVASATRNGAAHTDDY